MAVLSRKPSCSEVCRIVKTDQPYAQTTFEISWKFCPWFPDCCCCPTNGSAGFERQAIPATHQTRMENCSLCHSPLQRRCAEIVERLSRGKKRHLPRSALETLPADRYDGSECL